MSVSVLKYLGVFAQIAAYWEGLKHAQPHIELKTPEIHTRIGGRRATIRQSVEFEE